jgi:glutaredoxin 3
LKYRQTLYRIKSITSKNKSNLIVTLKGASKMSKKITVFTTNTCSYCVMVKKYLDNKGVAYNVVNLDEQPEKQKEIYEKSGALTVPVTLIEKEDSEEVVIGYNLPRLAAVV